MNSIALFAGEGLENIQKIYNYGYQHPDDFAGVVNGIFDELNKFGCNLIQEWLESVDQEIFEDRTRKHAFISEGLQDRTLTTSHGDVRFRQRWYTSKETGESRCLLEEVLGLEKDERVTEDAEAKILRNCAEHSYRESGCLCDPDKELVSKQTVMGIVHSLKFPPSEKPAEKKAVPYLYIDADEDHIARQFIEKKGDLPVDSKGRKINTLIGKIVYVYEGIACEAEKPKKGSQIRHRLIHPHYFCGLYGGTEENDRLWDEVYSYIDDHYDLKKVRQIYINADGGNWIEAGEWRFGKQLVTALDGFHLSKYLNKMASHMEDSAEEVKKQLQEKIHDNDQEGFRALAETLKGYSENEKTIERIGESASYIENNWGPAMVRLHARMTEENKCIGSSTEAHVYHILSRRMSTQPMGWSKKGADNMCRLRAYYKNDGDMLTLVRYTREQTRLAKAAGAEAEAIPEVISLRKVLAGTDRSDPGRRYLEQWNGSLSADIRKKFWFRNHYVL